MKNIIKIISAFIASRYPSFFFKNRDQLEQYQYKKLKTILHDVIKRSPFYSKFKKPLETSILKSSSALGLLEDQTLNLPIMEKAEMLKSFNEINTFGLDIDKLMQEALSAEKTRNFEDVSKTYTVGLSSGTSGTRGLFLVSDFEKKLWAATILAKLLPSLIKKEKIAFFLRANSSLYETVEKGLISFKFFDLLDPIKKHCVELEQYSPSIIVAPASVLEYLSENLNKEFNRLTMISVAETLTDVQKSKIVGRMQLKSKSFKLHEVYQATEGFLANTCKFGGLHLNEQHIIFEKNWIDEKNGLFYPVITDLNRVSQPYIRHKITDLLEQAPHPYSCPCKNPATLIKAIHGRLDDGFLFDNKTTTIFADALTRIVLRVIPLNMDYRLTQSKTTGDIVLTIINEKNEEIDLTSICLEFSSYLSLAGVKEIPKISISLKNPSEVEDNNYFLNKRRRIKVIA